MPGVTISSTRGRRRESSDRQLHLAGSIKWLPPKDELAAMNVNIDEGCCDHPIVILSPHVQDGKVVILIITSFGGLNLETKFPKNPKLRGEYLPIEPCDAHPDNGILLRLRDRSRSLRKKSYVNTQMQRSILLALLAPYKGQHPHKDQYSLSSDSYHELAKHAKFDAPVPHPSAVSITSPAQRPRSQTQTHTQTPTPQQVTTHPQWPVRQTATTPTRAAATTPSTGWGHEGGRAAEFVEDQIRRAREAANERARQQREARYLQHNVEVQAAIQAARERLSLLPRADSNGDAYRPYGGHPAYARPAPDAGWAAARRTGATSSSAAAATTSRRRDGESESPDCGVVLQWLVALGVCGLTAYGIYRGFYRTSEAGPKANDVVDALGDTVQDAPLLDRLLQLSRDHEVGPRAKHLVDAVGGKIQDAWKSTVDRWLQLSWEHERF